MELHPILENTSVPKAGLWYVVSGLGEHPSMRVGHTCTFIPGTNGHGGKVYVIGGANPDGSFADMHILDLDSMSWDTSDASGLKARYEHCAFCPASLPTKIFIFGGADQGKNHSDIQVYDTVKESWSTVAVTGNAPSPRTYHTNCSDGDKLYVYSGGQSGSDPVGDRQLHCFCANTNHWTIINYRGDSPKPRHGHVAKVIGNKLIVHGGMSGSTFYDDLHVLDLSQLTWKSINQKKVFPSARAGHGAIVKGSDLYIFGGMGRMGAVDDMFRLDTTTMKWRKIELEGPPPACRLDFGTCVVRALFRKEDDVRASESAEDITVSGKQAKEVLESQLRLGSAGSSRSSGSAGSVHSNAIPNLEIAQVTSNSRGEIVVTKDEATNGGIVTEDSAPTAESEAGLPAVDMEKCEIVDLCLVFGGMDTEGEIFDDCLALPLL